MNSLKNLSSLISKTPKTVATEAPKEIEVKSPEVLGQEIFQKKQKYYQQGGPILYVSKMLHKQGPLTYAQIWSNYVRDKNKPEEDLLKSKTHLKQHVMRKMREDGRIQKVGYDKKRKLFLGYRVVPERAFQNTHPDELLSLQPLLDIPRMEKNDIIYRRAKLEAEGVLLENKEN